MRPAFLLALLLCSAAFAQADGGATGVLTRPPTLVKQVEAIFPPSMLDAGTGGTVVMEVDLGTDGKVTEARVVQSAGAAFDDAALAAVRQFEFSPAQVDGQDAPVRIQYSYEFFFRPEVVVTPVDLDAGQVINFEGTLVERGTREVLPGATVAVGELNTVSDDKGHFQLEDVPLGPQKVVVVAPDYARYEVTEEFKPGEKTVATYYVRRKVYGAFETVVRAQRERKEVAQVTLKQEEMRLIPGTNGDAFKVVQNLPGVARSPFGIGLLVVRGSKPWDTRVYIDDTNVPLLFHFGGLFSTFNSNLLQDISFQPGNFGADFGRNIGGLIKGEVRTPSQKGYHGYADVNGVDASAMVEGPIYGDWSFAAAFRRSYIEVVLPTVLELFFPKAKESLSFTVAPQYLDWQVRVERRPKNGKSRFFVQVFGSSDALKLVLPNPALDPEGRGEFGTSIQYTRVAIGFDYTFSDTVKFTSRNDLGYDVLRFSLGADLYVNGESWPLSTRNTFTLDFPKLNLTLNTGVDLFALPFKLKVQGPPPFKLDKIPDPFISRQLLFDERLGITVEPALFAELIWRPVPSVKVIGGVRGDYDSYMNKGWIDPRLAVLWTPIERLTFKGGIGLYHQTPDYRFGELSPVFGNPNLQPEAASHYMVGAEVRFTDAISLDVQGYYRDLFHQARQTLAFESGDVSKDQIDLRWTSSGFGKSYGVEVLLRHALTKNFFGWISYSLSRTERDYNGGKTLAPGPFDQPHNLVVVASYKLPFDFIVGAKIRYTSGALNTPTVGAIYDANGNYYYPLFGATYSRRLPDFFQLDVRVDKRFVFERWMLALYVDVQNATNRGNVEGVAANYNYTRESYITGLPIIPNVGVRVEW